MNAQTATFAAGCFWGVEEEFRKVPGVVSTRVGYTGGSVDHATYHQVCDGGTGHAEAIEITFDPAKVSYETLLKLFWDLHDPTQVDRQGPDVGSQYRSAIFYHDATQKKDAESSKKTEQKKHDSPIATRIEPAKTFWPAEDYHQRYYEKRGGGTCRIF